MKLKLLLGTLMFGAITAHAQVATINENFNSFTQGQGQTVFPQNQWTAIYPPPVGNPPAMMNIIANGATDNFVQAYSGANQNSPQYLISPQIIAPAGDKTITFKARRNTGSASQYIVFKFVGVFAPHTVMEIDDVVYAANSTLAVSDNVKSKEEIKFAINTENTALQFVTKKDPKNIQIYSALGQKMAEGKLSGQQFDISALQTGVYYILIETAEGTLVKSKFIKK
jgi:hypothetical protein